ncbi:MAG TPA: hypothetical protein VGC41_19000, partial [Kofleriaceae bacterium]
EPPPTWEPARATRIFIIAFVIYDVATALVPALDQKLNTYPFSGFPMFSTVLAKEPYGGHSDYVIAGDHFEVEPPIDITIQRWFDHSNRTMSEERDPDRLAARMRTMMLQAKRRYPDVAFQRVRLYYTMFVAPAFPAPAHFEPHPLAIVGEWTAGDTVKTRVGPFTEHPAAATGYYKNDEPTLVPYTGTLEGDPIVVVGAQPDGTTWLLASHAEWRWQ